MGKLYKLLFTLASYCFLNSGFAQVTVTATAGTAGPTTYVTVNEAFAAINAGTHQGAILIKVSGSTMEPATPVPLLKSAAPSNYSSITIRPEGDATINSDPTPTTNRCILELQGADSVTIDGDDPTAPGTRNLTIMRATSTIAGGVISIGSKSTSGTDGATNIIIKNTIINAGRSSATSQTSTYGIVFTNNATSNTITAGSHSNDKVTIENNEIRKAYWGINATASTATYPNGNLVIKNNVIGSDVSDDNIGLRGILVSGTATTAGATSGIIEGNEISVGDYGTSGIGTNIAGIEVGSNNAGLQIRNNNIHDVANPNSGGWGSYGIQLSNATATTGIKIYNNFIRDITASNYSTSVTTSWMNWGIFVSAAVTGLEITHNTIVLTKPNINGTTTNATSAGININNSSASLARFLNNIVVNNQNSTNAYAIIIAGLGNLSGTVNNNNYYSTTGAVGYSSVKRQTLQDWTTATSKDGASINENPPFVSADDLHIQPAASTQLESAGAPTSTTGITTDIDGQTRPGPAGSTSGGGSAPDLGADEFDAIPSDLTAPAISYSPLSAACAAGDRMLSGVSISDPSGVPVTGTLRPRIYYQKNGGTWFSQPGTLASGTSKNGLWNFTIVAADLSPVAIGDAISYFIVAQDSAATPNIGSGPSGVDAANVNVINNPPAVLNSYIRGESLNGTYTVGSAGAFTTLTGAAAIYNGCPVTGPVVFSLTDAMYDVSETFPITINGNAGASATNTLTIRPSAGGAVIISGSSTSSILKLNGADYVVLEGLDTTGSTLTLENTNTSTSSAVIWLASAGSSNGATNNTIRNLTIKGNGSFTTLYGILSSGATMSATAETDNGNNKVEYTYIHTLQNAIFVSGNATTPSSNWLIRKNNLGSTNDPEKLGYRGVNLNNATAFTVEDNVIRGILSSTASSSTMSGITIVGVSTNGLVQRNLISNIKQVNTGGWGANGIQLGSTSATSNIRVWNNFIWDVTGYGYASGAGLGDNGYGMIITSGGGYRVFYNTVHLNTDQNVNGIPAALNISSGVSTGGIDLMNNIFANSQTTGTNRYAIYSGAANTVFDSMDYNNYYATGPNLGYIGTTRATLADVVAGFGKNANSVSIAPVFMAADDLHLDPNANTTLDNLGTPIPEITQDIDKQARSTMNPDMGADELPLAVGIDMQATGLIKPMVSPGNCYITDSIIVSIRNNAADTMKFASNPVTVTVNVTGAVTATYTAVVNTGTLAPGANMNVYMSSPSATITMTTPGTYTFAATTSVAGDINSANNAMTPVTRTKELLTAGTIAASPDAFCASGNPTLSVTDPFGWGSMQWQQSTAAASGFTDIAGATSAPYTVATAINQTRYYRLKQVCGTDSVFSTSVEVIVANPQVTSTTPGGRCGPGTVTLGATAATGETLHWYANPTGGAELGSGPTFVTPHINATDTFYVAARGAETQFSAGLPDNSSSYGTFGSPGGPGYGINFTTTKSMTIVSVNVYPVVAGTATIQLQTPTGTVITSTTATFTSSDVNQKTLVPLNFVIPSPGTYILTNPSGTAYFNRFNPYTGTPFPLSFNGGDLVMNWSGFGTVPTANTYYTFFDWLVSTACEGTRTPIIASINTAPALDINATKTTLCAGDTALLTAISAHPTYSYMWSQGNNTNDSIVVSPTTSTWYYLNAIDSSGGMFNGCTNRDSVLINVNMLPSTVSVTPSADTVCSTTGAAMLTVNGGTMSGMTIFSENFNGTAAGWTMINTTTGGTDPSIPAWTLRASGFMQNSVTFTTPDASQFILSNSDAAGSGNNTNTILRSPAFSTTGFTSGVINLSHVYISYTDDVSVAVQASTDGTNWTTLQDFVGTSIGTASSFGSSAIPLTAAFLNKPVVYIRFKYEAIWGYYWGINSVNVTGDQTTTITWTPTSGLFTDAAATIPYTGGHATSVYALPTASTTYIATATSSSNCTDSETVAITVDCTTVPVDYLSFKGRKEGSVNLLDWVTLTELNNKGFELQRSADGINFSKLAYVATKATDGSSINQLNYNYVDATPLAGSNYYRLRQIDKDGRSSLSNVVMIRGNRATKLEFTNLYPNPVVNELNVLLTSPSNAKVQLLITDIRGRIVNLENKQVVTGENIFKLNVATLPSGTYLIKVMCADGCETVVKKFVK